MTHQGGLADLRCYTLNGRAIAPSFSTQNRSQTLLETPKDHQKLSGTPREALVRPNPRIYRTETRLGRPTRKIVEFIIFDETFVTLKFIQKFTNIPPQIYQQSIKNRLNIYYHVKIQHTALVVGPHY